MGLKTVSKMSQVTSVTNEKSAWGTGVKSAERTLDLLELLADSEEALSLSQIAHRLDLPKSSAHGLLKTLERRGFARLAGGGYQLGLKALQVGLKYSDASRLLELSEAIVLRLNRVTNETVHLATLEGPDVVFLQIKPSTQPLRLLSAVGLRQSAHVSSVGKAQLATLTDEEVRAIYVDRILTALTPKTITSLEGLLADLHRTRARGYAFDDEESHLGVQCVGCAVRDASGRAVAGLSISAPAVRMRRTEFVSLVTEAAEELSRRLGFAG